MGKKVDKIKFVCPNCKKELYLRPCEVDRYKFCSVKCRKEYHAVHKTCEYCGKEYTVMPSQTDSKYCSDDCCKKDKYEKSLENRFCSQCGKEFKIQKSNSSPFCSDECKEIWHTIHSTMTYNCDYCGKEFELLKSKLQYGNKHYYCSRECTDKGSVKGEYVACEQCGKQIYKTQSSLKTYNHTFCDSVCRAEYSKNRTIKICEYCNEEYEVKSSKTNSRFCSNKCRDHWQSENLIGEKSPSWKGGLVNCNCDNCGKKIQIKPSRLKKNNGKFCSYDCKDIFYSNPKNRTDKQKKADALFSKNAVKYIKPTLTSPHKSVMSVLDKNNIIYRIEELIKYYKLDIYIPDFNLGIEVQGDFWHSNPNRFKTLKYKRQINGVHRDKSKHTYVKNKYGYEILYLWEMDITKNLEVCEKLILEYINTSGKLENYHSFNYYIDENDNLSLRKDLIIPYQDMSSKEFSKYQNIEDSIA